MAAALENAIIARLCEGRTVAQLEAYFPTLEKVTQDRLSKHKMSENAKLVATSYKCKYCMNKDQGMFVEDTKRAQVTCLRCGTVAQDRKVHDGEWKRQFADEENPSQHGPTPDPRFSSGHNLRTNITLGGKKGPGAKVTKKDLMDLKNVQDKVEMNLSNIQSGTDSRTTRIGYKDKQKKEVFDLLDDVGESLQLHHKITDIAKGYFADYRTAMEQIQNRDTVAAACLVLSLRNALGAGESIHAAEGETTSGSKKRKIEETTQDRQTKKQLTDAELFPFPCKKCGRRFGTKKDVRVHSKSCTAPASTSSSSSAK